MSKIYFQIGTNNGNDNFRKLVKKIIQIWLF